MKIQSLSVVVPNKSCINDCMFCVARMKKEPYKNQMDDNLPFYDLYEKDYIDRLEFARDNGCNTVMLTGNSEPQQNRNFLSKFGSMNNNLSKPFRWIEMQTTGVLLDSKYLRFLRNHVRVSTISLSLSAFDVESNMLYNGMSPKLAVDIMTLCRQIKEYDFNLRLSINMTDAIEKLSFIEIFDICKEFGSDQVTFRKLYSSGQGTNEDKWIEEFGASEQFINSLICFIKKEATLLEVLPYGAQKYSLFDMGVVIDDDCMSKENKDTYKYLILRPNCKLYSKWDDPASLIF